MTPWKTLSSTINVGVLSEGWNLSDASPEVIEDPRSYSIRVLFESPFVLPPVVQLSLTGFDVDQRDSARIRLSAEEISTTGFTVKIITWHDTRIYGVDFSWLALGS